MMPARPAPGTPALPTGALGGGCRQHLLNAPEVGYFGAHIGQMQFGPRLHPGAGLRAAIDKIEQAAYGAKLAARNALNGDSLVYDNAAMPWVVFTDPQVAGVGLDQAQARAAGYEIKTSLVSLDQVPRALAARDTRGLIKLVADPKTDRLLGAQILATEGGDSIQTMVLAIRFAMTAAELGETIFPYLTTAEGLKLAAQGFEKDVATLSCCAG